MDRTSSVCLALCLLGAAGAHATDLDEPVSPPQPAVAEPLSHVPPDLVPPQASEGEWPEPATIAERAALSSSPVKPLEVLPASPVKRTPSVPSLASHGTPTWKVPPHDHVPPRDAQARVVFPRGSNPTIICAPTKVCDIELQPGERVQGAPHIGDSVRWKISPAVSGVGERAVTHLIVKPTEPGLDTNLIVPTDRRTYHIRLVSSAAQYLSSVAFEGPDDHDADWQNLPGAQSGTGTPANDMPVVAVNRLNFNYRIKVVKGKPSFRPLRAMDDGYHTYIAMNDEMPLGEAPALVGISPTGEEQMLNYRLKGNLYVIDGTVPKLALISGAGRQQERIELTREPCRQRGWLGICWDPKE